MYTAFHQKFTDIGVTETRTVVEIDDGRRGDTFLFLELYCDEVARDCRRVFVHVNSVKDLEVSHPTPFARCGGRLSQLRFSAWAAIAGWDAWTEGDHASKGAGRSFLDDTGQTAWDGTVG